MPILRFALLLPLLLASARPCLAQAQPGSRARIPIAVDNSVKPEVYIGEGMPAPERTWFAHDYSQAAVVLQTILSKDPTRLPRFESKQSAAVFARMVAGANLAPLESKSLAVGTRMQQGVGLAQVLPRIVEVYVDASNRGAAFDAELVELMAFMLRTTNLLMSIADEFMASLPATDPDRSVREQGRAQMREGLASVVSGALTSIGEHHVYRQVTLLRLARHLERELPRAMPWLPPGVQKEVPLRLTRIVEQTKDAELKQALRRIRAALPY